MEATVIHTKKIIISIALLSSLSVNICLYAQHIPQKLPPTTIIGTATTVNTIFDVFDGDLNSFFASYYRSGGWVGLDLGEKHVITKVVYCSRKDWPQRLLLGVFEGANHSDFGDAILLCMITETPEDNVMTEQTVSCSRGFRYLRYVGPEDAQCNIAELEFWGYAGDGDDSRLFQTTNLPDVVIHTKNAADIVSKDYYIKGIVSIISENGTKIYTDSLDIRGRGHASWRFPKKPYRMRLYNKTNILDFPAKERSWTLINNWGDKTLMRNLLASDLSRRFEMPYTAAGTPVNVYLNGEFKGCYQLYDQIEIGSQRVNIQTMTPNHTTLPNLSGGYLIEIDAYAYMEDSWFQSNRFVPVKIRYPDAEDIVPAQSNYIRSYFNLMETAVFASNYKDPFNGFRKYIDTETFLRHFLVGEISGDTDTYWSTYMYKKRNDDQFYFGPVWDFDIAYDNDKRTYPINNNPNWIYSSTGSSARNVREMVTRMFTDEDLTRRLRTIYATYRSKEMITEEALLDVVDFYAKELEASQKLNFMRWNIMNTLVHENPKIHGSYDAEVENVKSYIRERIKWMDKKLSYDPLNPPVTGTTDNINNDDVFVWAYAGNIFIDGIVSATLVEIFNVSGNHIYSKTIHSDTSIPFPEGIYIVRLTDSKGNIKVVKCFVP